MDSPGRRTTMTIDDFDVPLASEAQDVDIVVSRPSCEALKSYDCWKSLSTAEMAQSWQELAATLRNGDAVPLVSSVLDQHANEENPCLPEIELDISRTFPEDPHFSQPETLQRCAHSALYS